jgi:hypothetical protein
MNIMENSTEGLREIVQPWIAVNPDGLFRLAHASGVQRQTILSWLNTPNTRISGEILTHACGWCEVMRLDDDASMRLILAFYAAHGGKSSMDDLLCFAKLVCDYAAEVRLESETTVDDLSVFYGAQVHAIEHRRQRKSISGRLIQEVQSHKIVEKI